MTPDLQAVVSHYECWESPGLVEKLLDITIY